MTYQDEEELLPEYLSETEDTVPEVLDGDEVDRDVSPFSAPAVETLLDLPADGSPKGGLYMTHTRSRLYGTKGTIEALKAVGKTWAAMYPNHPIGIGDISKKGGGKISGHASHQKGVDVDVRPLRADGQEKPTKIQDSAYSQELTGKLIEVFRKNGVTNITHIFFNDPALRKHPVQPWPNHDNHLHVRFAAT